MTRPIFITAALLWAVVAAEAVWLWNPGDSAGSQTPEPPRPNLTGYPATTAAAIEDALRYFEPHLPGAWDRLGETYFSAGCYAEAEACHRQAVLMSPEDPQLLYHHAFCLSAVGHLNDSSAAFQQAIDAGHSRPDACHYFLGLNALRSENEATAAEHFRQAASLPAAVVELAELAVLNKDAPTALRLLEELQPLEPNAWRVQHLLAETLALSGESQAAADARMLADILTGTVRGPWHSRAGLLQQQTLATDSQIRAAELRGKLASGLLSAGSLESRLQAEQTVLYEPDTEDLQADLDAALGNSSEQIGHLENMIKRDGLDAYRAARLGFALAGAEQYADAIEVLQTGLHLRTGGQGGETYNIAVKLAELLRRNGREEEASTALATGFFLRGTELLATLSVPEARMAFEESVRLDDSRPRSLFWLGAARELMGATEEARSAYRRCLETAPHHERAAAAIRRLSATD